jgi:hypothetical protein
MEGTLIHYDETQCQDFLAARLAQVGNLKEQDILECMNKGVIASEEYTESAPPGGQRFLVHKKRYVIRDDDLRLMDVLADGLKAAAGAGFFLLAVSGPQVVITGIVGVIVAGARLLRQAKTKGAELEPGAFRVLYILKANEPTPLSVDDITGILRRTAPDTTAEWVTQRLTELEKHFVNEGSVVPFACKDSVGNWRANGV